MRVGDTDRQDPGKVLDVDVAGVFILRVSRLSVRTIRNNENGPQVPSIMFSQGQSIVHDILVVLSSFTFVNRRLENLVKKVPELS